MNKINNIKELKKDYEHWNDVFQNGCNDPNWVDGMNLNLIRSHISYDKRMLEAYLSQEEMPELYFQKLPPKVNYDYIARPHEIMKKAIEYYDTCISIEGWNKLLDALDFLDSRNPEQESMRLFIQRIKWLKESIDSENYVEMRRYKELDDAVQKIQEFSNMLDEMELQGSEQMSLFQI